MSVIGEMKDEKIWELEKKVKELKNELDWVMIQLKCINEYSIRVLNIIEQKMKEVEDGNSG